MRYVARKLGFYLVAAWAALTINFFLPRLIPGNPVELLIGRMAQSGPVPPGEAEVLTKLLGLGTGQHLREVLAVPGRPGAPAARPVRQRTSPTRSAPRSAQSIFWTLILVGTATVISFVLGIALGVLAGWKRGSRLDAIVPATTLLTAMPYFWLALILLYVFATNVWHVFPLGQRVQHELRDQHRLELAVHRLGGAARVPARPHDRAQLRRRLAARHAQHDGRHAVRGLRDRGRGQGAQPRRVMIGYAARNAVLPSLSGFAISLGFVVSGAIAMEYVFSYPGIGYKLVQAVSNDDYPLMQGIFLVITFAVLGANLIVDLLYGFIDPRTRMAR